MNDPVSRGPGDPHDPLSRVLRTWRHSPAPAPHFADNVWSRIRTQPQTADVLPFPGSLLRRIPLPLAASITILLSIAAGASAALNVNRAQATRQLAAAYVRTIDPAQMTHGQPAPSSSTAPAADHARSPS